MLSPCRLQVKSLCSSVQFLLTLQTASTGFTRTPVTQVIDKVVHGDVKVSRPDSPRDQSLRLGHSPGLEFDRLSYVSTPEFCCRLLSGGQNFRLSRSRGQNAHLGFGLKGLVSFNTAGCPYWTRRVVTDSPTAFSVRLSRPPKVKSILRKALAVAAAAAAAASAASAVSSSPSNECKKTIGVRNEFAASVGRNFALAGAEPRALWLNEGPVGPPDGR